MRRGTHRLTMGLALLAPMVVPAQAADWPQPSSAIRPLGPCGGTATGFLLPGGDACLTIGGFVRAEAGWALTAPQFTVVSPAVAIQPPRPGSRPFERPALGAGARLTADMRIPTELGPLRVFVSLRSHNGAPTDRAAR